MPTTKFVLPLTAKLLLLLTEFPDTSKLNFIEDEDQGSLYGLTLVSEDTALVKKIAGIFGCPVADLPEDGEFTNSDSWKGEMSFRDLADELTAVWGEFFDETLTLGDLRGMAGV